MICAAALKLYFGAVARRIEIELTSARPDGTWTWRAAGALNPRGSLDAALLYGGAKAGDVVRAEAEFGIEGITVVSVEPPRVVEKTSDANRIELIERPVTAGVTTQLAGGRARGGPERGDRGSDRRRDDQGGPRRPARPSQRPGGSSHGDDNGRGAPRSPESDGAARTDRPASDRPRRTDRPDRPRTERPDRPQPVNADGTERAARPPRPVGGPGRSGPGRPPRETNGAPGAGSATGTSGHREPRDRGDGTGQGSRATGDHRQKRLNPGNTHRNAMLESLSVEDQAIAQQLLRGGIPAVRTALHFERERAREEGRPEPSTEGVMALAESLVSKVKAAEWRDKAESAIKAGDELAMRDLRSLVSVSDGARDEASRGLVVTLRELLERRVEEHRVSWANDVAKNLDQGQVVRALRLSSRPPDATTRFSAELATRLRDAASAALSATTPPDQWLAVLEAVIESPVRRTVKPAGLPANPSPELLATARKNCGQVPGLAPLLGISVPPPPGPVRPNVPLKAPPRRPARPPKPSRPVTAGRPAPAGASASPAATTAATSTPTTVAPENFGELAATEAAADEAAVEAFAAEIVADAVADVLVREMPAELLGNELAAEAAASLEIAAVQAADTVAADLEVTDTEVFPAEDEVADVVTPEPEVAETDTDDALGLDVTDDETAELEPGGPEVGDDAYDAADLARLDEVDPSPAGEPAAL
jgi:hypothetical protein